MVRWLGNVLKGELMGYGPGLDLWLWEEARNEGEIQAKKYGVAI